MAYKNIFFILLLISFFSCKKDKSNQEITPVMDVEQADIFKVKNPIIKLNTKAKKMVKEWDEYQKMDEFIPQYYHISTTDALFGAKEFSKLSQQLKDSIRVDKLNIPSVKIRLNVLNNEILRLLDLTTIAHLAPPDVLQQNQNILDAYFALNLKINNIISRENLNSDINLFIEEIINNNDSIGLKKEAKSDSIKLKKIAPKK